jgi:hypothetical protein
VKETPPVEPPEGPGEAAFRRFADLVRRELHAEDVRLLEPSAPTAEAVNAMFARLPDGRTLALTFAAEPPDAPALERRLQILAATFAQALEAEHAEGKHAGLLRRSVPRSLHEELRALAQRALAVDALVLDAHSPVVWGSSTAERPQLGIGPMRHLEALPLWDDELTPRDAAEASQADGADEDGADEAGADEAAADEAATAQTLSELSARAIREVRSLPEIPALRRGRHLHHAVRDADFGYVAQAFAAIYLLVLVYEAPFDEIRAERAVAEALPRIERLVLALPPLDPTPEPRANVISLRTRARR